MIPTEVFLSHSSRDGAFVASLVEMLRRHGVPVWYSATNIVGAQQWHDEIGAALNRCDWFVLVLSPNSISSKWVSRELQFALQQDRFDNHIVPLIYEPCAASQLSWVLPSFQNVDFTGNYEEGCRNLLRIWGVGYRSAP